MGVGPKYNCTSVLNGVLLPVLQLEVGIFVELAETVLVGVIR
jgi:hypothetical protein